MLENKKGFTRTPKFGVTSKRGGFTLVETLVGSAIFLLVALSAYKAFGVLMDAVTASRAKLVATTLANEKFEIIRNLPFQDIGIQGGLPSGKLIKTETTIRDNFSFNIETTIRNIDDVFDGTIGGNPADTSPADYKLADLSITCSNCKIFSPLKFTTIVAPHALETASTNGALFIRVFDTSGIPIANTEVHIVNTNTNPDTIIDETTDNDGWIKIVDAPPGTNAYNITATKTGFTTDQTYPPGGIAGPTPINPDANVVIHQVTQADLLIDRVSSLSVTTVDASCVALPNIGFSLTGTKFIGTPSVLKYPTQNFTTNASGIYEFSNLEWDTYTALLTSSSYDLAGMTPLPSFTISPNENKTLQMVVVPHANNAFLVSVKDASGNPIDGASVQLQKTGFDETKNTNSDLCATPGEVFWNGLASGTYTLNVSKAGYQTYTNNSINMTPAWQNHDVILIP
jgi:prepilin-type N-terminal cleavage/methylation domain-containing protein